MIESRIYPDKSEAPEVINLEDRVNGHSSLEEYILEELGLNVLRLKAEFVEKNLPLALGEIRRKISELKLQESEFPSPFIGEGLGERKDTNE